MHAGPSPNSHPVASWPCSLPMSLHDVTLQKHSAFLRALNSLSSRGATVIVVWEHMISRVGFT